MGHLIESVLGAVAIAALIVCALYAPFILEALL